MLSSLAFLGWYNELRFGSLIVFSYNGEGFHTPIGRGLEGLLLSPGKSLLSSIPWPSWESSASYCSYGVTDRWGCCSFS